MNTQESRRLLRRIQAGERCISQLSIYLPERLPDGTFPARRLEELVKALDVVVQQESCTGATTLHLREQYRS